jgi:predicted nuclease of predicted toxin-antitoxin system
MDVHIPSAITRALRRRGVMVVTAQDDNATEFADSKILDRATDQALIVFSMDQDFLSEAARRLTIGETFSTVIFARPQDITIGQCVRDLEIIAQLAMPDEQKNQILYLPL